jgi:hypothetical protein
MNHDNLMRQHGLKAYLDLLRKANADAGPPPQHFHVSGEEQKQCAECQEWQRGLEASFERVFRPFEDNGEKRPE